ncbi:MAG: tetraacyldisaccharide 4'-kinase, partial [Nitrospiraceae bacterium]
LIDASDPAGLEALLPAGRLREPLSAAARATALLLTRADAATGSSTLLAPIRAATGSDSRPILIRFIPDALVNMVTGMIEEVASAAGRTAVAFSGIGNAVSFRTLLADQGVKILDDLEFPDHHAYTAEDLSLIRDRAGRCGADMIVTTEKDAVKVATLVCRTDRLWALRLRTEIMEGQARLEGLLLGNEQHGQF